jgi:hypothetical protein
MEVVVFGTCYPDVVKLIHSISRAGTPMTLRGFIDDRPEARDSEVLGYPVLGTRARLPALAAEGVHFFSNVTGSVRASRAVARLLEAHERPIPSLVHPSVDLAFVELGHGGFLPEGCLIGSRTRIGKYLAARQRVTISHDVTLGDHVFVGPGSTIGSGAVLEDGVFLGAGVTVKTGCRVGAGSVIGAGALVAEDVATGVTMAAARGRVVRSEGRT